MICAVTIDRFIAVQFPLRRITSSQRKYAITTCICLTVLAVLKNTHVFWTRGMELDSASGEVVKVCGRPEPFTHFELYIRPWIAFFCVAFMPLIIISICNLFIIRALYRSHNLRSKFQEDKGFLHWQTVIICLTVSFVFLILIIPSIIIYIGKPYWNNNDEPNNVYTIAKAVNDQLVYVNHCINFMLYCIVGKTFRQELKKLYCCYCSNKTQVITLKSQLYTIDSVRPKYVASSQPKLCQFNHYTNF